MSKVVELFGHSSTQAGHDWQSIIHQKMCPFASRPCYKTRKTDPQTVIGTCAVKTGKKGDVVIICPTRLIQRRQIFLDCMHLLTAHEPGHQLHIVPEVAIPGGNVDYFLVSAKEEKIKDFVGIEIQTVDTTGTVWPERQRLLRDLGVPRNDLGEDSSKKYGMNWKMTAKTILVQMHHKVQTFEHVNKHIVLVTQHNLLQYMTSTFDFEHLSSKASLGDPAHFHSYRMVEQSDHSYIVVLDSRLSTDVAGIARCLDMQGKANVELEQIVEALQEKISAKTLFEVV